MRVRQPLIALLLLSVPAASGCGAVGGAEGSEESARKFMTGEFDKWIAGRENEVVTLGEMGASPIGYEFRSVVPDEPGSTPFDDVKNLTIEDWDSWPAYRFNVAIEFESRAGTPLDKVATYTATWNPNERKWHVQERF
jgi:hypothetical protein